MAEADLERIRRDQEMTAAALAQRTSLLTQVSDLTAQVAQLETDTGIATVRAQLEGRIAAFDALADMLGIAGLTAAQRLARVTKIVDYATRYQDAQRALAAGRPPAEVDVEEELTGLRGQLREWSDFRAQWQALVKDQLP